MSREPSSVANSICIIVGLEAEAKAISAAESDALSPEPWRLLGQMRLERWLRTGENRHRLGFVQAADNRTATKRTPMLVHRFIVGPLDSC